MSSPVLTAGPVIVKARDPALPDQRSVAVLNTGGTISMKANAAGSMEPSPGYLAERIGAMLEFDREDMPAVCMYELLPLLDSSDMGPDDWIRIAALIEELYYEHDGFVVIMGTDTMAYGASALSFLLENLHKPVVLTGAMLPLVDLFNDAHRNLIVAIVLASMLDVPEVCVFINDKLMRGNRTVKVNSSGLDAFDSPNFPPLALLETGIRFRPHLCLPQPRGRFRAHRALATGIAVWRMIPGMDDEYLSLSVSACTGLRAIVLEIYGTGNLSARKASLLDALAAAIARGIIVVAASQCLRGTVNLGTYALGSRLSALGVVAAADTTTEAITAKLSFLLAAPGLSRDQVAALMGRSLRGEVTEAPAASVATHSAAAAASTAMAATAAGAGMSAAGGAGGWSIHSSPASPSVMALPSSSLLRAPQAGVSAALLHHLPRSVGLGSAGGGGRGGVEAGHGDEALLVRLGGSPAVLHAPPSAPAGPAISAAHGPSGRGGGGFSNAVHSHRAAEAAVESAVSTGAGAAASGSLPLAPLVPGAGLAVGYPLSPSSSPGQHSLRWQQQHRWHQDNSSAELRIDGGDGGGGAPAQTTAPGIGLPRLGGNVTTAAGAGEGLGGGQAGVGSRAAFVLHHQFVRVCRW